MRQLNTPKIITLTPKNTVSIVYHFQEKAVTVAIQLPISQGHVVVLVEGELKYAKSSGILAARLSIPV